MRTSPLLAALLVISLLIPLLLPAASPAADRRLERVLEDVSYDERGLEAVDRAYRAAVRAGLDRRDMLSLVKLCVEGDFEADQTARVLTIAAQLSLAGLPCEGFESKIKEGVAKNVEPIRILAAGEQWALAVNRAKNVLNSLVLQGYDIGDDEELLSSVARAFETGKDEKEVREVLVPALEDGDNTRKIRRRLLR